VLPLRMRSKVGRVLNASISGMRSKSAVGGSRDELLNSHLGRSFARLGSVSESVTSTDAWILNNVQAMGIG
jgi:hypothetical protein